MKKAITRKDIIKNAAIVFLAVMLVLTFFSNTILNWSLAEIKGKYTEYGEIKTGVRGSGTVISNLTYTETVKRDATVQEVLVARGTRVEAGQILMRFAEGSSVDADTLRAEIESLEESYKRALLTRTEYDYYTEENEIKYATEELDALKAERALYSDERFEELKVLIENNEAAVKAARERVDTLTATLESIVENSTNPAVRSAADAVEREKEQVAIAAAALEKAEKALAETNYIDVDSMKATLNGLYDSLSAIERELKYFLEDNEYLFEIEKNLQDKTKAYEDAQKAYESAVGTAEETEKEALRDGAKSEYDSALAAYETNKDAIRGANRTLEEKNIRKGDIEGEIYSLRYDLSDAETKNKTYNDRKNTVLVKRTSLALEESELEEAEKKLSDLVKSENASLTASLKSATSELEELSEETAVLAEEYEKYSRIEALDEEIKASQRSLDARIYSFEKRKEADLKSKQLEDMSLEKQYKEIQQKKETLLALEGKGGKSFDLVASHSGVVTSVSFRPGEFAPANSSALVIEVEESGYTLSFSVSNAEAQKVSVGDTATVSDAYWGQKIGATLASINADAGGKTRTLTFELDGNVEVGQTLTLLVGERTTGYSSVIPKSALHEDAKGKFIFITKEKSTPLGKRYVATRLDVKVIASDDKNVAIATEEDYIYEYVILTSTKPFNEGDYVRLSD